MFAVLIQYRKTTSEITAIWPRILFYFASKYTESDVSYSAKSIQKKELPDEVPVLLLVILANI